MIHIRFSVREVFCALLFYRNFALREYFFYMKNKELIECALSMQNMSHDKLIKVANIMAAHIDRMKEVDIDAYWKIIRQQSAIIFGKHFCEDLAKHEVSRLCYVDRNNRDTSGEHWTMEQSAALKEPSLISKETTDGDIYVAMNIMYSLLCRSMTDSQIIDAAVRFFFEDPNWPECKVWEYVCCN